jgi:hypothetical protein
MTRPVQELEKIDLQHRRACEEQDFKFQLALFDAVSKGLEHTPKCPDRAKGLLVAEENGHGGEMS